ncbi:L-lactate dehydrogenase complex protein LldG [Salinibacillus kushneri]|uniref:Lactate utilization protein C n=1 Tax=Salinibacillus kushneri TaxID=237682 RepID=A0A1H9YZ37_9BACI|nr:lactate utilization protein C [Salinibacillus kushneri]SES74524.1 L-lactate dehydrogenase complex protein LldG [Salinibacillus kushneri]
MAGKIMNKKHFLNHVAGQLGRERIMDTVERPEWKHQPQWNVLKDASQDELVDILKEQCKSIHTEVLETNKEQLSSTIQDMIKDNGGGQVVTWDDPRFQDFQVNLETQEDLNIHVWDPRLGDENIRITEQANLGITFSDITLAESGTVVLFSDAGKGRSVSLLPSTYIAIIPKNTIVPRMTQAAEMIEEKVANGEQVASCVNFISGPSNSADIEMNLIVGVHGPIKATYIIVDD